jgi:hypothetical protein
MTGKRKNGVQKRIAAAQAAKLPNLSTYLSVHNQAVSLRGARAPGLDGEEIPVDWLGSTTVIGITESEITKDLASQGLTREDVRPCLVCGRLHVFGSRKTQICSLPECRRAQWRRNKKRAREAENEMNAARLRANGCDGVLR